MLNDSPTQQCAVVVALLFFLAIPPSGAQVDIVDASTDQQTRIHQTRMRALAQADQLPEQTADLLGQYRSALQRLGQARAYNRNLAEVVADQKRAMSETGQQIVNYERSSQDVVPLMLDMIESLDRFIELDLPFHLDERRDRVAKLRDSMGDSGIARSEKFRRILEAYQIEIDFGRTIDAYTGWLETDGARREVNFLRVGRVVLAYQTHDQVTTGFFNPAQRQWQPLPNEYRAHVADGLRIARKQAAPYLVRLPVAAPVAAQ